MNQLPTMIEAYRIAICVLAKVPYDELRVASADVGHSHVQTANSFYFIAQDSKKKEHVVLALYVNEGAMFYVAVDEVEKAAAQLALIHSTKPRKEPAPHTHAFSNPSVDHKTDAAAWGIREMQRAGLIKDTVKINKSGVPDVRLSDGRKKG